MTVVAVHPDSESLEYHMDTGKEEFRKFADLLDLLNIEAYGDVNDSIYERLRQKAQMLEQESVTVYNYSAGFFRNTQLN